MSADNTNIKGPIGKAVQGEDGQVAIEIDRAALAAAGYQVVPLGEFQRLRQRIEELQSAGDELAAAASHWKDQKSKDGVSNWWKVRDAFARMTDNDGHTWVEVDYDCWVSAFDVQEYLRNSAMVTWTRYDIETRWGKGRDLQPVLRSEFQDVERNDHK